MEKERCKKCQNFSWRPATNEDGWICIDCDVKARGEPDGYRPDLDYRLITLKVEDLLFQLTNEAELLHISNGSEGDVLTRMIANRCKNENRYDQYSIIKFIFDLQAPSHGDYWRNIGMRIREGNDPRDRCDCGKLANCWHNNKKYCSEHSHLSYAA